MKYAKEQLFKQTDFLKGWAYIYSRLFIARATNAVVVLTWNLAFISFSSFHVFPPYFQPEDSENLIKKFFRCHLVVQNRKYIFYDWLMITRIKTTGRLQKDCPHMRFGRIFPKIMSSKFLTHVTCQNRNFREIFEKFSRKSKF